jgi:hypothetical protein
VSDVLLSRVSASPRTTATITAVHTPRARRPWAAPTLLELPRLAELTLQTGAPIGGSGGSGGVTFP